MISVPCALARGEAEDLGITREICLFEAQVRSRSGALIILCPTTDGIPTAPKLGHAGTSSRCTGVETMASIHI